MNRLKNFSIVSLLMLVSISIILMVPYSPIMGIGASELAMTGGVDTSSFEITGLKPGQRGGDHYLDDKPAEYLAFGESSTGYYGSVMDKIDFNGDSITDMVISAPRDGSGRVLIYDGSTQLKFPDLGVSASDARWELSGSSSNFGTDFSIGDVNGDGYDDILVSCTAGSSGSYGDLFYGGPYVNSLTDFTPNATFSCSPYGYYGSWVALGDLDGDGYDEILVGQGYQSEQVYPPGYDYWYNYWYGTWYWWWGSDSIQGDYPYQYADVKMDPPLIWVNDYTTYGYDYHYTFTGMGGVATGDMNGDGRDEVALGSPMSYQMISTSSYTSYVGAVSVMYPGESIREFTYGEMLDESDHMDWVDYPGSGQMDSVGADPIIYDYNMDGYGDLIFNSGYYPSSASYPVNGKYCWIINGDEDYTPGSYPIKDKESYTMRLSADGSKGFGAHAFGDYNGDGKPDLALGDADPGSVYVVLYDDYADETGDVEVTEISSFTVHAPKKSSTYFAHSVEYYRYYSYEYGHKFRTICFLNRDDDGLDDLFISDPGGGYLSSSGPGVVYGISNYDMFGIGIFEASSGDKPDGKTYYSELKSYKFKGSAWNRWAIWGPEMEWDFMVGIYSGTVRYSNPGLSETTGIIEVIKDPYGIVRVDPDSLVLEADHANDTLYVSFNVYFTLDLPAESSLDVMFHAKADHMNYDLLLPRLGSVKNRFMWVGGLDGAWKKGDTRADDWVPFKDDSWVPENSELQFSGMKLIYNGTQDWMNRYGIDPFYPNSDLFNVTLASSLGDTDVDPDTSGRNFTVGAPAGDRPIAVKFYIDQDGIPPEKVINEVPVFTANVDIDTPTAPPGVQVHADAFDDTNIIVDNEGELYVTWNEPGEFNSGVAYYEIECDGVVTTSYTTFAKVTTTQVGDIPVKVRAVDRVAHVGPWSTASIFIDDQLLEFSNFQPVSGTWFNMLSPQVGVTITDLGGRAIIGKTIEYMTSIDAGATWSAWDSAGMVLNAKSLDVMISPVLSEGQGNLVMFRAEDEAGNILTSAAYDVSIDISGVMFDDLRVDGSSDWDSMWFPDGTVDIALDLSDSFSGIDGSSLQYRMSTRGRSDLNSAPWMSLVIPSGVEGTASINGMDLSMGDRNFVQFRVQDLVGNAYTYSPAYNIWIDTMPELGILSPESGSEFLEDELVTFDATPSFDVDGDVLTYTWTDTVTFGGSTETLVLGSGLMDLSRFSEVLPPGKHSLVLTISDGVHDIVSDPITFVVVERVIPIWLSSADIDGDGMPNYWEYTYYLGWDDASNKDTLYNANSMSGKSRTELYADLSSVFATDASAATADNDADGDGHTDFEEYLAGTSPIDTLRFPVYKPAGEKADDQQSILLPVLIAVCLVVIVVMIVVVVVNNGSIKRDLEASRVKDAEDEKQLMENALASGGRARLDNLLASAKGEASALPSASVQDMSTALPSAEPSTQPMEAQPMEAQPISNTSIISSIILVFCFLSMHLMLIQAGSVSGDVSTMSPEAGNYKNSLQSYQVSMEEMSSWYENIEEIEHQDRSMIRSTDLNDLSWSWNFGDDTQDMSGDESNGISSFTILASISSFSAGIMATICLLGKNKGTKLGNNRDRFREGTKERTEDNQRSPLEFKRMRILGEAAEEAIEESDIDKTEFVYVKLTERFEEGSIDENVYKELRKVLDSYRKRDLSE